MNRFESGKTEWQEELHRMNESVKKLAEKLKKENIEFEIDPESLSEESSVFKIKIGDREFGFTKIPTVPVDDGEHRGTFTIEDIIEATIRNPDDSIWDALDKAGKIKKHNED